MSSKVLYMFRMTMSLTDGRQMATTAVVFEHRPERGELVSLRVSAAERRELERLARKRKTSLSDVLRAGVRRLHADAECVAGSE
jgi:hypothetical protein